MSLHQKQPLSLNLSAGLGRANSLLDVLLLSVVEVDNGHGLARVKALGRGTRALRVTRSLFMDVARVQATLDRTARQPAYDLTPIEQIKEPLWFECDLFDLLPKSSWIPPVAPNRIKRRGWLVERDGNDGSLYAYHFVEGVTGLHRSATWRVFRDANGHIAWHVLEQGGATTEERDGERLVIYLMLLLAPAATEIVPGKPPRRGQAAFSNWRLAPPWDNVDEHSPYRLPVIPAKARPAWLVDELLDAIEVWRLSLLTSRCLLSSAELQGAVAAAALNYRSALQDAERFVLGRFMVEAAAEIAVEERTGMEAARASLTLPFPLAWLEWLGGAPGLPEARWGLLLQADPGDDVRGGGTVFLLGAPPDWTLRPNFFGGLFVVEFRLEIADRSQPLLELRSVGPGLEGVSLNVAAFARFLQIILTFLSQPRMAEIRANKVGGDGGAANRARAARGLPPLLGPPRTINLVMESPAGGSGAETAEGGGQTGVHSSGMALHTVRAFWRFKLGKLEFVRPHWRGDPAYGVSRRVYHLLSPADIQRRQA